MKTQKNKIVFVLVAVCVVVFITLYAIMTFGKEKETALDPERIPVPDLEENQTEYDSKLEALEAIKEERETMAPPLYPDHMVDDKGYFNPDYMEYEKQRIIDSVYQTSVVQVVNVPVAKKEGMFDQAPSAIVETDSVNLMVSDPVLMQELELAHQLFFSAKPEPDDVMSGRAHVEGNQIVKDGHRLVLRLDTEIHWDVHNFSKDALIYGFVKIRPNRVLVDIVSIGGYQVHFKAFDLQDGEEGIYVENQLRGEVLETGVDATLGDINIPGVPQMSGVKRIFQRHNRSVKVAIQHQYQLHLKQVP